MDTGSIDNNVNDFIEAGFLFFDNFFFYYNQRIQCNTNKDLV